MQHCNDRGPNDRFEGTRTCYAGASPWREPAVEGVPLNSSQLGASATQAPNWHLRVAERLAIVPCSRQNRSSRCREEASYKYRNVSVVRPTPAVERTETAKGAVPPLTSERWPSKDN